MDRRRSRFLPWLAAAASLTLGCGDDACMDDMVGSHAAPTGASNSLAALESPFQLIAVTPPHDADSITEGDRVVLLWDGDPGPVSLVTADGRCVLAGSGRERTFLVRQPKTGVEWGNVGHTISYENFESRP